MKRVNLSELKEHLGNILKENASQYWECLRKYTQAKLSKWELDSYARAVLGEENVPLHNEFIKAILLNALVGPPAGSELTKKTSPSKKDLIPSSPGEALRTDLKSSPSKRKKKSHKSSSKANASLYSLKDRKHLAGLLKRVKQDVNGLIGAPPTVTPRRPVVYNKILDPTMHFVSPTFYSLKSKMLRAATDAGLTDVSNDSVTFMMKAVELHMKRILGKCLPVVNSRKVELKSHQQTCAGGTFSSSIPQQTLNNNTMNMITPWDLSLAVTTSHSSLLGANLSLGQERITMLQ